MTLNLSTLPIGTRLRTRDGRSAVDETSNG
jgi:hypothetical protein